MRRAGWLLLAALAVVPLVSRSEEPRPATLEDVRRMAEGGELEAAAGLAETLLAERPNDVDLHVVYQDVQLALGGAKDLLKRYKTRAQREGAGADDAYLHARLLDARKATGEHARTLRLNEKHVRTLLALAELRMADDALDDAATLLTRAMNAEPGLAAPRLGLAEVFRRQGDLERSEEMLRAAVEGEPGSVQARVELAVLLMETTRYDEARTLLGETAERAPDDPLPQLALGHLERMLGRDRAALEAYQARLEAAYAAAMAAHEQAAQEAVEKGEKPPETKPPGPVGTAALRALDALRLAVDVAPRSFPALVLLGHAATVTEDGLTADSALRTAQEVRRDAPEPGLFRTRMFLDQDYVAEAEGTAAGVLTKHRDLPVALYLHGIALARLGKLKKAEKDLERAVRESGELPLYLRGLAAHHAANARWRDALKILQKAVRATDAAPYAVYEMAVVQRGAGKSKEAASSLEALVADDPEYREAWLLLGRVYLEDLRKMEDRALECLLRFQELGGEHDEVQGWIDGLQGT